MKAQLWRNSAKRASHARPAFIPSVLVCTTLSILGLVCYGSWQSTVLLVPSKTQQHLVFVQYGPFHSWQAVSLLHTRLSNFNATTNLLLQSPQPVGHEFLWTKLGKDWGVRTVPSSSNAGYSAAAQHLRAVYRHSSANKFEYEFKAFERYLVVQDFVEKAGMDSVLMIDFDIVVFEDIFRLLPPDTTITPYATFATHWSRRSLDAFVEFMFAFYSRNVSAIVADLSTFGDRSPGMEKALQKNADISSWWPDGVERAHFSDMYMLQAFIASRPELMHTICTNWDDCAEEVLPFLSVRSAGANTCDNSSALLASYEWKPSAGRWLLHPHLRTSGRSVPAVHFQGPCKNLAAEVLCTNVAREYGDCSALVP